MCGSEDFEKKKEANGLKKKRLERLDPLETSSLSLMKKSMSYVVIGQDLGGLWLMPMWNSENVFVIQYVYDLYYVCLVP